MTVLYEEREAEGAKKIALIRAAHLCALASSALNRGPMRRAPPLKPRLNIQTVDIYDLSEVMGPGVASECAETKDGPTVWEDHFYPEIIDPDTGDVLHDGEFGDLVFTSLAKEALPIIRYRTRDLTRLHPGNGRTMRRMEKIIGLSDEMMFVLGVNVFPSQIEELILKQATPSALPMLPEQRRPHGCTHRGSRNQTRCCYKFGSGLRSICNACARYQDFYQLISCD